MKIVDWVPWLHGAFYFATGVWPLVHMRSFELITGPKQDKWLVRTVGLLVAVQGAVVLKAARDQSIGPELRDLAIGTALALAAIDVRYGLPGRISRIYLLDAVAEVALAAGWCLWRREQCQRPRETRHAT